MSKNTLPPLFSVSAQAAAAFEQQSQSMLNQLNDVMIQHCSKQDLLGENSLGTMKTNNLNHINFMINVFKLNDYEMLSNTLVWVFGSYVKRGFNREYFPITLMKWIAVIKEHLSDVDACEIIKVYEWMIASQASIEELFDDEIYTGVYPYGDVMKRRVAEFADLLIRGDMGETLGYVSSLVKSKEDIGDFYTKVLTHAMYTVGKKWENGEISVAQEHLATSIVVRIMSMIYMNYLVNRHSKGHMIVTASENEYHELGARVVADIFELDGWEVKFLGANTPSDELLKMIQESPPDILCISVTMTFNIQNTINLIEKIRAVVSEDVMRIIVGGYALHYLDDSENSLRNYTVFKDVSEAVKYANQIWREECHEWRP